ncbi:hypothetical protein C5F52_14515 [Limnohabitans sp. TS-CS-82]|uniref:hypothetical protein n=1 Tax=Limnohabitans sp. TS-CS-82 TaxID=2094193 RepID=UPI000CF25057|nr:hypothetical protein [Limnohabitans sp. TS-CS-82]PQA82778.1 hypothetical protein C5F52_14515 [Limnohabitans sp. TS-CS-82]
MIFSHYWLQRLYDNGEFDEEFTEKSFSTNLKLVSRDISNHAITSLIQEEIPYWNFLCLVILRGLKHSLITGRLNPNESGVIDLACRSIGIENAGQCLRSHGVKILIPNIIKILTEWEEKSPKRVFPDYLKKNLQFFTDHLKLSEVEAAIFGLFILIQSEPILSRSLELMGEMNCTHVPRVIATLLNLPLEEVETAFLPKNKLHQFSLVKLNLTGVSDISTCFNLMHQNFGKHMCTRQDSPLEIILHLMGE